MFSEWLNWITPFVALNHGLDIISKITKRFTRHVYDGHTYVWPNIVHSGFVILQSNMILYTVLQWLEQTINKGGNSTRSTPFIVRIGGISSPSSYSSASSSRLTSPSSSLSLIIHISVNNIRSDLLPSAYCVVRWMSRRTTKLCIVRCGYIYHTNCNVFVYF